MSSTQAVGGATFNEMFRAGTQWLEKHVAAVDALNVFPVPDGDTGTNMVLTLQSALEEGGRSQTEGAGDVLQALAHGALLGARGNSGVILSQIMRGLAQGLAGKDQPDGREVALALCLAAETAYKGVAQPVEGTMLTVMREAAEAARAADTSDVAVVLQKTVDAARVSLANTPNLLPVLKEAGVVDAGGQGLLLLLEGALAGLQGQPLGEAYTSLGEIDRGWLATVGAAHGEAAGPPWGYCTQFLLRGSELSLEDIKAQLASVGNSILVVGDPGAVRVHLHTLDPGAALSFGTSQGSLDAIKIENMQEQHAALLRTKSTREAPPVPVVAVVPGEGLQRVFRSLGATEVVSGGQSMNPSTREIAAAVESIPAETVLLLPNNPNVLRTCQQVHLVTKKTIEVVPTKTLPQGIAALLALNQERSIAENLDAMQQSLAAVETIEVTTATRDAVIAGVAVKAGQPIGLLNRDLVAAGATPLEALGAVLDKLAMGSGYLVTLYYGEQVSQQDAETVADALRNRPDHPEVEVVWGGQPHYPYIASVET